ncbi:MAG: hypothetical protein WD426_20415 [Anditalea sp.]
MKFFYLGISKNPLEVSEVHRNNCPQLPSMLNRTYLGSFNNAKEALRNAKGKKENVTICSECCQKEMSSVAFFNPVGVEEQ